MRMLSAGEISCQDEAWLEEALRSDATAFDLKALLADAIIGKVQIWRLWDCEGVLVTQHEPDRIFILALVGKRVLRRFDYIFTELLAYAHFAGKKFLAGQVHRKGLLERYQTMFNAQVVGKEVHAPVPEIARVGLQSWVQIQTSSGPKEISALKVGDKVLGPRGEQTITDKILTFCGESSQCGMGPGELVWVGGEWVEAEKLEKMEDGAHLMYNLTVEPDHEFFLANGKLVHNLGGGAPEKTTTVSEPWAGAKPYISDLYSQASQAFKGSQGQTNNSAQKQALQIQNQVAGQAGVGADVLRQNALDTASGMYLDPARNPMFRAAQAAAFDPIVQRYQEDIFPQMGSAAQQMGAYGGSRQGVLEARGASDLARELSNVSAAMTYQNYAAERQNQINAAQQFGNANALALAPADIYQNIATTQQQLPFQAVNQYANIINGIPTGQSTTSTGPGGPSRAAGALGGAATGAAAASALGLSNPWTAALIGGGALLGGLG